VEKLSKKGKPKRDPITKRRKRKAPKKSKSVGDGLGVIGKLKLL